MTGQDQSAKQRLEAVELRLAKAVERLEIALKKRSASGAGIESELAHEISCLQLENGELKGAVGQAAVRLDATIGKLKDQMCLEPNLKPEGQD
ncbi:MAG: hypothetical protein JKY17_08725 [Magnetovibrio sp.]|nr:hypothetical protein [Magnetovibrio sp.]